MKQYLLALDEGTTSARAILFDKSFNIMSLAQHEFTQIYPKSGWVEQDAIEIYSCQVASLTECITKSDVPLDEIAGIGITNQRETTIVWDKKTGKPIYNAIVWQCRRTAPICEDLKRAGYEEYVSKTTGLRIDPYFSGTKIKWILDNVPGAREKANQGELLFGTVDTWLIWKLTGGKVHVTDRTNASRTMLYSLEKKDWDDELLSILDIPKSMLPKICSSSEVYGEVEILGATIPICGIAGDQQAALFGQGCFKPGDVKTTYGTGCFLLAHIGSEPIRSQNGLLTTVAATGKDEPVEYALEGSVFIGGAVIQWLRDEMKLIHASKDSEYFAMQVEDAGGVYVVPAFSGLGAPYWDSEARGIIVGLSRGSNRNHIIRASLESIAYQTSDVISAMEADTNRKISHLKADGGASANRLLMQFQSDISNLEVFVPDMKEATAAGAAALAGLAIGVFKDKSELQKNLVSGSTFVPSIENEKREKLLSGWKTAIAACKIH